MLNVLWMPLTFQDTALMAIAVPATTIRLAPENHVVVLAVLASTVALRDGGRAALRRLALRCVTAARRLAPRFRWRGLAIDVAALIRAGVRAYAGRGLQFCSSSRRWSQRRTERVPGVAARIGAAAQLGRRFGRSRREHAGRQRLGLCDRRLDARTLASSFLATAVIMAVGGLSLFGVSDGTYGGRRAGARSRLARLHRRLRRPRARLFRADVMLQTFVLFFFRDMQKVGNPSAGTALYAFCDDRRRGYLERLSRFALRSRTRARS